MNAFFEEQNTYSFFADEENVNLQLYNSEGEIVDVRVKCGGTMIGDGYTLVRHCEFVDDIERFECDSGPIYCNYDEEDEGEGGAFEDFSDSDSDSDMI